MKEAVELLVERLRGVIGADALASVLGAATRESCAPGSPVLREGEVETSLYFIERGEVEIVGVGEGGVSTTWAVLGSGEFIGEVGFVDGLPRTRSVRARTEAIVWRLRREDVEVMDAETRATFFRLLSVVLARRFREVVGSDDPVRPLGGEGVASDVQRRQSRPWVVRGRGVREALNSLRPLVESTKEQFYDLQRQTGRHRVMGGATPLKDARVDALLDRLDDALRQTCRVLEREADDEGDAERLMGALGAYIRRELYAYLMASHVAERIYLKPKGDGLDFMVVEQIHRNRTSGEGLLGTLVDGWLLGTPMLTALRQRRSWMTRMLDREATRLYLSELSGFSTIEIMALGLASGRELFDFVLGCQFSERLSLTCVDADIEALTYANTRVNVAQHQATVRFVRDNVTRLAQDATGASLAYYRGAGKDIVYSATLLDMLPDAEVVQLARACRRLLKPGGVLYLANVHSENPQRYLSTWVLEWPLRHRSAEAVGTLVAEGFGDGDIEVAVSREGADVRVVARAGNREVEA